MLFPPELSEAIKAALHYPAGLNAAKTFADVNAPFAADAYRYENGQVVWQDALGLRTGKLPRFVKQGFRGPVYCSRGTAELLRLTDEIAALGFGLPSPIDQNAGLTCGQ